MFIFNLKVDIKKLFGFDISENPFKCPPVRRDLRTCYYTFVSKVYSQKARDMKMHRSLLERLFEFSLQKRCRREILLDANYRTCPEILTFLSKVINPKAKSLHNGRL